MAFVCGHGHAAREGETMIRFVCRCGQSYRRFDEFCAHLQVCPWPEPAAPSRAATQRAASTARQRARRARLTPAERAAYNQSEAARQRLRRGRA